MEKATEIQLRTHRQLRHTFRRIHRAIGAHLEPWGITSRQYSLLSRVSQEGVTLTELASFIGADPSTANGIVNRLEKAGYVDRQRCELDRRIVRIKLTDQGRLLRDSVGPGMESQISELYGVLDDEELNQLCELLARLMEAVS